MLARHRVIVHGQQRQRLAIVEPLPRHVVVRHLVRHLAHQHGAAEVVHAGSHAHGAARGREAAVGRHQQARAVCGAIGQQHLGHLAFALRQHARDGLARHQRDAAVLFGGGLHLGIGRAADVVVGHQPAQLAAIGQRVANEHGKGGGTVEHAGIAQWREGSTVHVLDAFPQAQLTHEGGRALRECDLATIEGSLAQRLFRLLLHQTDGEARIRQGTRQTKTGRTGTADEEIEFHGQAPEKTGQGSLIDPRDSRLDGHHQAHGDVFSMPWALKRLPDQGLLEQRVSWSRRGGAAESVDFFIYILVNRMKLAVSLATPSCARYGDATAGGTCSEDPQDYAHVRFRPRTCEGRWPCTARKACEKCPRLL